MRVSSPVLHALTRSWWLVLATLTLAVSAASVALLAQRPVYTSTALVFVSTPSASDVSDLSQGSTFTQQIVKSYATVATSSLVLSKVARNLGSGVLEEDLVRQVNVTIPADEVVLEVQASAPTGVDAANIANAVASVLAQVAPSITSQSTRGEQSIKLTTIGAASPSSKPSTPIPALYITLGILLGLVGGLLLAVARDQLDARFGTVEALRRFLNVPLIGAIARDDRVEVSPVAMRNSEMERLAENFRGLRVALQYLNVDGVNRSVLITSSRAGEGKSTVAVNVAVALADSGQRVILVDADLRRPKVHSYLGIDGSVGLTDLLAGRVDGGNAIQSWGELLRVLPAGTIAPNPNELLGSNRFKELLDQLESGFDIVIIDSPPLLAVSDAAVLAKLSSIVIVVAAMDTVTPASIGSALSSLVSIGVRVEGVVASKVRQRADAYGYENYARRPSSAQAATPAEK